MTLHDQVILGADYMFSTDCEETGINNNILVCGGSGSGKTMSISEPRLLNTYNSNLIVTVTKRRLVDKYKPLLMKRGYEVFDLNFIEPTAGDVCYDPLRYVKGHSDIAFLSEAIVRSNPRKHKSNSADPYWDEAAISLLSAEIAYTMMSNENATFADVLELHDKLAIEERGDSIRTSLDADFEYVIRKNPSAYAATCWKSFRQLPIKTASCVYGALNTTIDTLFTPELRKMIKAKSSVDFKQLASKKTVLFVSTSAVNPALNCFVSMFYAQTFKQLFEFAESQPNGMLPFPTHILCDDFATGSKIHNFAEYISIIREKRISVTLLLQSESQLAGMYGPDEATTIINNCDTYVFMGSQDLRTGQNISLRMNWPLDEVLYMPIGQEIIFRRGQRPTVTTRYDVRSNRLYQWATDQYERGCRSKQEDRVAG